MTVKSFSVRAIWGHSVTRAPQQEIIYDLIDMEGWTPRSHVRTGEIPRLVDIYQGGYGIQV